MSCKALMTSASAVCACHKDCQAPESFRYATTTRADYFLFKLTAILCIYDLCKVACPVPRAHSHRLPEALLSGFRIERMMSVEQLAASTLPVA